ncbi:MAG: hypothetical protein M1826_004734 [Phylliscum demangeonii]|nr:MAG: hypothetical protein M1826_004734 [Phylliscum demangeonii]
MPSIRFIAFQDPRPARPTLSFPPISRTLSIPTDVVRVGRYSEKETQMHAASMATTAAPVGFKSKVVSRRHCEFWCSNGQWYIKDVKSSSGTFLNHIRLSQPSVESKPWRVNDGDIVQLGIDFKGGEEMIYRCVKMRVECNRDWQKTRNCFNTDTLRRLRNLSQDALSGAILSDLNEDVDEDLNEVFEDCTGDRNRPEYGVKERFEDDHEEHSRVVNRVLAELDAGRQATPQRGSLAPSTETRDEGDGLADRSLGSITEDELIQELLREARMRLRNRAQATEASEQRQREDPQPASAAHIQPTTSNSSDSPLDENAVLTPVGSEDGAQAIPRRSGSAAATRQGGDGLANVEGPLTPSNDLGPFVFNGTASSASRTLSMMLLCGNGVATAGHASAEADDQCGLHTVD